MTAGFGERPVPDSRITGENPSPPHAVAQRPMPPVSGLPYSWPAGGPPPLPAPAGSGPRRGRAVLVVLGVLALLVVALGGYGIYLQQRLAAADHRVGVLEQNGTDLKNRVAALERGTIDVPSVAGAVLPSVFRIDVPDGTATAFAVGRATAGTDMLTNFHVVQTLWKTGARDASIVHDDQRFAVHVVRVDEADDLALLHADATFPALRVAADALPPGTPVAVIGAPLGLAQSVTSGVVSAVRNDVPGDAGKTYIQFDAAINPGNSGGPVVNSQKQVVGIAAEKAGNSEGIGLAIPISRACQSFSGIC